METYPHISTKVTKLGEAIPTINIPAGLTCRCDAPCRKGCYAMHGNFLFKGVRQGIKNNYTAYLEDPDFYFTKIKNVATKYKFFRYHSSGDIPDMDYLIRMIGVAKEVPTTRFLCFTKKYEFVNEYLDSGEEIPENLSIVFSHWGDFPVPNPYNLPTSHVRFKKVENNIPERAYECPKFCGDCVNTESSCWHLKKGEAVVFNQH